MARKNPLVSELSEDEARMLLTRNFDLTIHDLSCHCDKADPSRASGLLLRARWTVKDAFDNWMGAWLGGEFDA